MVDPAENVRETHILVVDDNRENLRVLASILSKQAYIVRFALDGRLALESVYASPPDLILLDIMMPGIDGYAVCKTLKAVKRTRDIPIIFISALQEVFDKVKAFSVGGVDYITKPFQVEEVLARVSTHLMICSMQQQLRQKNECLLNEINERKQAEEAYMALAHNSKQALLIMQNGAAVYVNPMMTTLTAYTKEELFEMSEEHLIAMIHPEDQAIVMSYAMDHMVGKPVPSQYEHRIVRKDGDVRWVEVFATLIQYRGRSAGQAAYIDVTERHRAEEAYHNLVDHSLQGLIILQEGRIIFANSALVQIYGYTSTEMQAMTPEQVLSLVHPDDLPAVQYRMQAYLDGKVSAQHNEHRIVNKDGTTRWVEVHGVLIDFNGKPAFQLAFVDITERKQTAAKLLQQQQAFAMLRERERIARELHDNLGQVLAYLNMQSQAAYDHLVNGRVDMSATCLSRLITVSQENHTDVREFILGVTSTVHHEYGFFPTLETYIQRYQQIYAIPVSLFIPPELRSEQVSPATEAHLLRIIQEALTNVRKHAKATTASVTFSCLAERIQVMIEDNGTGFNLLGSLATAQKSEGQGYGLQSMRERVCEIGGTFQIETHPGSGTKIIIRFSLSPSETLMLQSMNVMLVDDQPLFLEGMQSMLTSYGVSIVGTSHNGLDAVEKARLLHPNVILMDVEMPVCNGIHATRLIKSEMPEIQIVMLTVSADDDHLFEAIKNGASGYLLKNLNAGDFFHLLSGLGRGEVALSPGMAKKILQEFSQWNGETSCYEQRDLTDTTNILSCDESDTMLSDFQRQILMLVAQGNTYREVGEHVGYSERSIKNYMSDIIKSLHVRNRADAIAYAKKMGLVSW
jgi:PAS domain S-box-containing protein